MGFIVFIGFLLSVSGWYVYARTPTWLLTGSPNFMNPILKAIQEPDDFMGILTLSRLRDYSLIIAIIGTGLVILPLLLRKR